MQSSGKSGKKPIEETEGIRPRKAKLEYLKAESFDRKKVEEKLQKAEPDKEILLNALMEHVVYRDTDMRVLWANNAACESVGLTFEELTGHYCYEIWHGRSEPCVVCPAIKAMETGQRQEMEVKTPDGRIWLIQAYPIRGVNGSITGSINITLEITEHKKAEETLRESEERLQAALNAAELGIWDWDFNTNKLTWSGCHAKLFGYKEGEFDGHVETFDKMIHPEDLLALNAAIEKAHRSKTEYLCEYRVIWPDGTVHWILSNGRCQYDNKGRAVRMLGIVKDITERKRVEEALTKAENEKATILNTMSELVTYQDAEHRVVWANRAAGESVGSTTEKLLGRYCYEIWHERNKPCENCPVEKVWKTGRLETEEIRSQDGRVWSIRADPVKNKAGNVIGVVEITLDITERKKAEEALKRERDKAQKYLDVAAVMLVAIDCEQRVGLINKKGCELLGYKEEEILRKNWFDNFLPERVRKQTRMIFEKTVRGEIKPAEYYENPVLTKGGNEKLIAWHNTLLRDDKGNTIAILSSGENITERKKAEQKLLEYQRQLKSLASELTLAEERERHHIANGLHDQISQSLVSSKIELDALRHSVSPRDPGQALKEVSDSLGKAIDDMRSLTFDLSFPILYELGFEAAVATWLADRIQKKHGIATEFEDDELPKPLDDDVRVLLFRTLRELLFNVVKHAQAKKVKVSIRKVGSEIHVSVEDDGIGFDTKKVEATAVRAGGFGLFSIRERLEQLGGYLEIKSAPGCGTKVTLIAPLKQEKVEKGEKR